MTQEDKELLLKDLSARAPYGVKVHTNKGPQTLLGMNFRGWESILIDLQLDWVHCLFMPYLRPMSSMTDEEKKEYRKTQITKWVKCVDCTHGGYYEHRDTFKTFDWLNKHHFDYRGLIKKGLALEAPEGMYKPAM